MATPDIVVIGHAVRDLVPGGWRLGGTVTYASFQAQRLGLSVGVVTRPSPALQLDRHLPGVEIAGTSTGQTTTCRNIYERGRRRQRVLTRAEAVTHADIPSAWRSASIVILGPVYGELPPDMPALFPHSLVGVCAQGWLRTVDRHQRVRRRAWTEPPFWSGAQALFASEEDLGRRRDQLDHWTAEVPVVAVTADERGARVHGHGAWRHVPAYPARHTDPTGAGDVFALSFLVCYQETGDLDQAARFGSAAAACSVEGTGTESIAARPEIEARMAAHPEVALR